MNPHAVTRDFEAELCRYTGAPYAVAVTSCSMALLLAVAYRLRTLPGGDGRPVTFTRPVRHDPVSIPRRTYVSVPMSVIHAGGKVAFRDEDWQGCYELKPLRVVDSARWFTSRLYPTISAGEAGWMVCVSFHASKTLGIEQGGAVLHDDPAADAWLRKARFDGRREGVDPKDDDFEALGWHCYMSPSTAAQGLLKLHSLPPHNAPLANSDYPDLSTLEVFR